MSDLKDFAKSDSAFLTFGEQNPIVGIYKGTIVEDDPFMPGSKRLLITLGIDGTEKKLGSKSKRLARALVDIKEGQKISITRSGQMMETRYKVEVVGEEEKAKEEDLTADSIPF